MAEIKGNLDVQDVKISGTATIKDTPVATKVNGLPSDENNNIDLTKWGTVQSSTSLNSHVDTGFFTFESTSTEGSPESTTSNGYNATLIDINTNPKNITTNIQTQLVITEENKIFVRSKKSKIYSNWDELATQKWVIDNGGSGSTNGYTKDEADAKFLPITSNKKATIGSLTIDIGTTSVAPITFVTDQEPYTFNFPKKSGTLLTEESADGKYALSKYYNFSESNKQTQLETYDSKFTFYITNDGRMGLWSSSIGGSTVRFDATGKMDTGLIPVANGGTGGKTATEARTNLQIYSKGESDSRYISQTEPAINYKDGSHAYLRYNEGTAGRRAYVGFPSDGSTTFTIANEHSTNPKMHFSAKSGFSFDGTISCNNIIDSTNALRVGNSTTEDRVGLYCNPGRAFISPFINGQWTGEIQFAPGSGTFATREWVNGQGFSKGGSSALNKYRVIGTYHAVESNSWDGYFGERFNIDLSGKMFLYKSGTGGYISTGIQMGGVQLIYTGSSTSSTHTYLRVDGRWLKAGDRNWRSALDRTTIQIIEFY